MGPGNLHISIIAGEALRNRIWKTSQNFRVICVGKYRATFGSWSNYHICEKRENLFTHHKFSVENCFVKVFILRCHKITKKWTLLQGTYHDVRFSRKHYQNNQIPAWTSYVKDLTALCILLTFQPITLIIQLS